MNDKKARIWLTVLLLLAVVSLFGSLLFGQQFLSPLVVLQSLSDGVSALAQDASIPQTDNNAVVWFIRLPRVLAGFLVGAALAVSGAVMQGIFCNPLADSGMLGLSSGASVGAVMAISLGLSGQSLYIMPLFAFTGAIIALMIVVALAMKRGRVPVMVLLLSGVAVNFFNGAITSGLLTILSEYRLREYLFWMVGGLDYRRWEHVLLAAGPILFGVTVLVLLSRHLNVLALGEDEARGVGLPVAQFRLAFLALAAATTAAAVCISGSIGFVGLVVPHMMRFLVGPDHRLLLPASALAGGVFLVLCDTLGRSIFTVAEVRVGIVTALLGAPYFLYLLCCERERGLD